MTPCTDCQRSEGGTGWPLHNPACLECGGRYLKAIQRLQIGQEDKRERLRAALKVWMEYGHSEAELRRLAARKANETSRKG